MEACWLSAAVFRNSHRECSRGVRCLELVRWRSNKATVRIGSPEIGRRSASHPPISSHRSYPSTVTKTIVTLTCTEHRNLPLPPSSRLGPETAQPLHIRRAPGFIGESAICPETHRLQRTPASPQTQRCSKTQYCFVGGLTGLKPRKADRTTNLAPTPRSSDLPFRASPCDCHTGYSIHQTITPHGGDQIAQL